MLSNPYEALTRTWVHMYVVIRYLGDKFHLPNNYYMYVMFSDWYRIDLPPERFPPPFINFPKHVYPSPSYSIYIKCIWHSTISAYPTPPPSKSCREPSMVQSMQHVQSQCTLPSPPVPLPLPPTVPFPLPPVGVRFLSLCRVHSTHHAPPALDGLIATEHQEEGGPTAKGHQGGGDHMINDKQCRGYNDKQHAYVPQHMLGSQVYCMYVHRLYRGNAQWTIYVVC